MSSEVKFTQQTFQSLVFGFGIAVLMAAAALVSATGLLYGAKWAQVVAIILSFPASTGFSGLLTALYTWWVIGSKQLNAEVVGSEGVGLNIVEE